MDSASTGKVLYFAYGSNMDAEQLKARLFKFSSRKGGVLHGYGLHFNKPDGQGEAGYANVVPSQGLAVEGIIYETDRQSLEELDRHEGVHNGEYGRETLTIKTPDGEVSCEVYVAKQVRDGAKPRRKYLERLLCGREFLSQEYFAALGSTKTID